MHRNLDLFLTFSKISVSCFGGGYAMLPFFQRDLAEKKGWVSSRDLSDIYAISQCTPGVISVNTATAVGSRVQGFSGALCATLGLLFPPMVIITVLAAWLWQYSTLSVIQHALGGIRACVCALMLHSVIKLAKDAVVGPLTAGIAMVVFLCAALWGLSPVLLVAAAGAFGLAWSFVKKEGAP